MDITLPQHTARNTQGVASLLQACQLAVIKSIGRFRFGFQYLYRYHNLSFSQSDVSDLPD